MFFWAATASLIVACIVNAKDESVAALTVSQRIERFRTAPERCRGSTVLPLTSIKHEYDAALKDLLLECGYAVRPSFLTTSEEAVGFRDLMTKLQLTNLNEKSYEKGTVHFQTMGSGELDAKLAGRIQSSVLAEGVISQLRGDILAGPSQDNGVWTKGEYIFPPQLMRRYGVSPTDASFPVSLDVIVPLQDSALVEVCLGEHYIMGLLDDDCRILTKDTTMRQLCDYVLKHGCPKENAISPQIHLGDALIVDSLVSRRFKGSGSDPMGLRMYIHGVIQYGWWLKEGGFRAGLISTGTQFKPNQNACEDMANRIDDGDNLTEEAGGNRGEAMSTCAGPSQGILFFANHDVEGDDVAVYFGNDARLASLPVGGKLTVPTVKGSYTLRIEGVARKMWMVKHDNETHAFYASTLGLDYPYP